MTDYHVFKVLLQQISSYSKCLKKKVGCLLLDKNNNVLSTAYNISCLDSLDLTDASIDCNINVYCESNRVGNSCTKAIHAEIVAINKLSYHELYQVTTVFVSYSPCMNCLKRLSNMPNLSKIYYINDRKKEKQTPVFEAAEKYGIAIIKLGGLE